MKLLRVLAPALLLLAWTAAPATAGPPPIGAWVSARGSQLAVTMQATCTYIAPTGRAEGQCVWQPSPDGGILIIHQAPTATGNQPQQFYLDIRSIDATTIVVQGEQFRRTQW